MGKEENIVIRIVLEVVGAPREHVEKVLKGVVEKAKQDFKIIEIKIYEAKEINKLFSAFAEVQLEMRDVTQMLGLCFDYIPSSIEIISPDKLDMKNKDIEDLLNDLLAQLHRVVMVAKNLHAENLILKKKLGIQPKK